MIRCGNVALHRTNSSWMSKSASHSNSIRLLLLLLSSAGTVVPGSKKLHLKWVSFIKLQSSLPIPPPSRYRCPFQVPNRVLKVILPPNTAVSEYRRVFASPNRGGIWRDDCITPLGSTVFFYCFFTAFSCSSPVYYWMSCIVSVREIFQSYAALYVLSHKVIMWYIYTIILPFHVWRYNDYIIYILLPYCASYSIYTYFLYMKYTLYTLQHFIKFSNMPKIYLHILILSYFTTVILYVYRNAGSLPTHVNTPWTHSVYWHTALCTI